MEYREFKPSAPLAPLVDCIWQLRHSLPPGIEDTILPDGCTEILINLGSSYSRKTPSGWVRQPDIFHIGQFQQAILLKSNGPVDLIGIRLKPYSFWKISGLSAHEVLGQEVDIKDLGLDQLKQRLLDHQENRLALIEAHLISALHSGPRINHRVSSAYQAIMAASGNLRMSSLNGSLRQVQRLFKQQIGLSPKAFANLIRLHSSLSLVRQAKGPSLTHIAHDLGFSDLSHFSREFQAYSGQTPKAYRLAQSGLNDLFI